MVGSFIPRLAPKPDWSDQKAAEYQQAALELHGLAAGPNTPATREQLADAQTRYQALRGELDAARSPGWGLGDVMFWGGAAMVIGAGLLAWAASGPADPRADTERR